MSNKAMKFRHWTRIENLTKFKFDLERPGFALRDIMEAPLLPHKEDIEDICISAMKEKDIEAKLKGVVVEWSTQELEFLTFKNRFGWICRYSESSLIAGESCFFVGTPLQTLSARLRTAS